MPAVIISSVVCSMACVVISNIRIGNILGNSRSTNSWYKVCVRTTPSHVSLPWIILISLSLPFPHGWQWTTHWTPYWEGKMTRLRKTLSSHKSWMRLALKYPARYVATYVQCVNFLMSDREILVCIKYFLQVWSYGWCYNLFSHTESLLYSVFYPHYQDTFPLNQVSGVPYFHSYGQFPNYGHPLGPSRPDKGGSTVQEWTDTYT